MKLSFGARAIVLGTLAITSLNAFAISPTAGCGQEGWTSGTRTMHFDGLDRTFRVHVPVGYSASKPAPLVAIFHGWTGDENGFIDEQLVRDSADRLGYVLVAPRGLGSGEPDQHNNSWTFSGSSTGIDGHGGTTCDRGSTPDNSYESCGDRANSCGWTHCQQDDVAFTAALLEEVGNNLCIDQERIFATGGSNGGMFSWELAQNPATASLFRAIAPVIGLPHRGYSTGPGREGEIPALLITGTLDEVVPPGPWDDPGFNTTSNDNDRYYYESATAITRIWADAHGCDTSGKAMPYDAGVPQADCRTYCSEDAGMPRVLDCRAEMAHDYGLAWSWDLSMTFFEAHSASTGPVVPGRGTDLAH